MIQFFSKNLFSECSAQSFDIAKISEQRRNKSGNLFLFITDETSIWMAAMLQIKPENKKTLNLKIFIIASVHE